MSDDGLLAGDRGQIRDDGLQGLGVFLGFATADVYDDLLQARNLHRALVLELLHQRGSDFIRIFFLQTCHTRLPPYRAAPQWRQTRVFSPLSSTLYATRVGSLHLGQTAMTLLAYSGASTFTMPP